MNRNGFTLVEVMVVLAIMALLVGGVIMTVGTPGGGPADAATRFATRIAAARDAAILSGRPTSVWVTESGYGFEQYRGGRWQPASSPSLEGSNWGDGVAVRFAGNGEARSRVRFDSLGLADTGTRIRLERDGRSAEVTVAANGNVRVR